MSSAYSDQDIKKPNVSGQFYPSNPKELHKMIQTFLDQADVAPSTKPIKVIISPHAGYIYSGPVAVYGYKAASKQKVSTAVILAPSHYFGFDGVSIWQNGAFETPLGKVPVNEDIARSLLQEDKNFIYEPRAFEREHSLEVEIPFLQEVFKEIEIVPVIMGQPSFETLQKFAAALKKIIGQRKDVLLVVSTDLSHFHPDQEARKLDKQAVTAIKDLDAKKIYQQCLVRKMEMCGFVPVTTAVLFAQMQGLTDVEILHTANSGDVTGDRSSVVGYASIVIYNEDGQDSLDKKQAAQENISDQAKQPRGHMLSLEEEKELLNIAEKTIDQYIRDGKKYQPAVSDSRLKKEEGAFVTIHERGMLRGCIGNIIGRGPLYLTVRDMAISAATQDPRFPPLKKTELDKIDVEVSVLSKPKKIQDVREIEMGRHGVIVSQGIFHRGVFLPQVADETGWSREEFLDNLCRHKAGLPANAWKDPKTEIQIFEAQVFSEKDLK